MRESIIMKEMEADLLVFRLRSTRRIWLKRRCNTNTLVIFNFLQLLQLPIKVPIDLPIKLHITIGVATLPHYQLHSDHSTSFLEFEI